MTLLTGFCKKKKTVLSKRKIVEFCHKTRCKFLEFQIKKLKRKIKTSRVYPEMEGFGGELG